MSAGGLARGHPSRFAALCTAAIRLRLPAMVAGLGFVILLGATPFGEVQPRIQLIMVVLGAIVVWLALLSLRRGTDRADQLALAAYLLILIPIVLSNFLRQSVDIALSGLALLSLFVVSRRELADRTSRDVLLGLLSGVALGVGGLALVTWGAVWIDWVARFGSLPPELPLPGFVFGNVHDVAILVVLCTPAVLIEPSGWRRIAAPIVVIVAAAVVVIDGSRNVLLGVALASAAAGGLAMSRTNWQRRTAFAIGAVALLIAASAVAASTGLLARLLTPDTLGIRLALWSASVDIWSLDPIFGQGPGTFPWLLQRTDYFAEWAFAPRHPDNLVFQLLAEGGLVGLLAGSAAALAVAVGARATKPPLPLIWALLFFVACGLLANPTDFGFLVVPAVLLAGLCTPMAERRPTTSDHTTTRWAGAVSAATAICGVLVLAIALSFPVGGMVHERSGRSGVESASVEGDLLLARQLDPGLALYHRELAALMTAAGDPAGARTLLQLAVALNPSDLAARRLLALTAQSLGDASGALRAAETAVDQKETDVTNWLTLAQIHAAQGRPALASEIVADVVYQAPWVTGAMDLGAMGLDLTSEEAIRQAVDLWQQSPQDDDEHSIEPMWLVALEGDESLLSAAATETGGTPVTARSLYALLDCRIPDSRQMLESARSTEGGSGWYWIVRYMLEAVEGTISPETEWFARNLARRSPAPADGTSATALYNGLADPWGYGQWPLTVPRREELAPTEIAGLSEWMRDPVRASRLGAPTRKLATCETGGQT